MLDNQIIVPDISEHNKSPIDPQAIDFSQMYHAGARGVLCRMGQGLLIDKIFESVYKRVLDHYLFLLNYWYIYWHLTPLAQMKAYLAASDRLGLAGFYELDYEQPRKKGDITTPVKGLNECIHIIYNEKGIYPAIYTSPGWWNTYPSNDPIVLNCPLHIAHWKRVDPIIPAPFTKAFLHQFDVPVVGYDYGIQTTKIDLSIGYESLEYYYKLANQEYQDPAKMSVEQRLTRIEAIHTF